MRTANPVLLALTLSIASSSALAQSAFVTALVTHVGEGRDLASTNEAVRSTAERLLARCEPAARAARPLAEAYLLLDVDASGRITSIRNDGTRTQYFDDATATYRPISRARAARVARWVGCAARALRALRLPPGPADHIQIHIDWQESDRPQGVMAPLNLPAP